MKIALGSVQFGCDYGVSNNEGQVSTTELSHILTLAKTAGIEVIDTAPAYGNSEQALGEQAISPAFNFVSKVPPNIDPKKIHSGIKASLQALKTKQLSALMLHHGIELLGENGKAIYHELLAAKQRGLCKKIGCSVYSAEEALKISHKFPLDIVQIPANIFDQGIFKNDILEQLKSKKIEIHVRSLFLQGAVFINAEELPDHLIKLAPKLIQLKNLSEQYQQNILTLALSPFVQHEYIDRIVLGCCSAKELQQIIDAYKKSKQANWNYKDLAVQDETLINPSLWP